ncbi:MAG: GAF domain-containing protein [Spirochaetales bacterium]|nr:GAF domain-containing protein [Spirochaetales bacterium]
MGHLLAGEDRLYSGLSNAAALLNWYLDGINWVGFYLYDRELNLLVLGPFQGLPACTRIPPGRGVCGRAFSEKTSLAVDDVLSFPGHIACDSASRSELVVPIILPQSGGQDVAAVLDIDSPSPGRFDKADVRWMEELAESLVFLFS